jgi:Mn2+/Fe2+ NRAMP family transporter
VANESPGDLVRRKGGRWLAGLVGCAVFFISCSYQAGNNLGVAAAFEPYAQGIVESLGVSLAPKTLLMALLVCFNLLTIVFLFALKDLYTVIERLMMVLVGVMLVCFAANLIALRPNPLELLKGFIPSTGKMGLSLTLLALVGTTFSVTAAFYQAYLVRQKGWTSRDLPMGMIDVRVGLIIMALITMMLMCSTAAGLHAREAAALHAGEEVAEVELKKTIDVATSMEGLFGSTGKLIFCLGLFAAAYSSFLINIMIGGFLAADGLGLGSRPTDRVPRVLAATVLMVGISIALAVNAVGWDHKPIIIAAQAVTVIASPLLAGVLLWLASSRDVMGEHVASPMQKVIAAIGLAALVGIGYRTAFIELPKKVQEYRASFSTPETPAESSDQTSADAAHRGEP